MGTFSPAERVNPYENPELWRWAGGMEGVPEWVDPAETAEERRVRVAWRAWVYDRFALLGALLPGLGIAFGLAWLGRLGSEALGSGRLGLERSPVSPILVAILLGLAIRNGVGLPSVYEAGLRLCLRRVLRLGVALLGLRLSLEGVGAIGLQALPIILACIAAALLLVHAASRAAGLPVRLGILVAVGTAICGNTAIVATAPVIGASEDETSYAVGTITVFGLLALVTYPFLSHALFGGDAGSAGLFLGTAIHDTAQVAGAGLLYAQQYAAPEALDTATVTKLVRNAFMVAVIPLVAWLARAHGTHRGARPRLRDVVPGFVLVFVALSLVRTLGDHGEAAWGGLVAQDTWTAFLSAASLTSSWCLTIAMASVGLGTHLGRLRALGLRPLAVGLAAALAVGGVSAALIGTAAPG
jgi:uncharacterized integral membrane protein (TIGR00698 family)